MITDEIYDNFNSFCPFVCVCRGHRTVCRNQFFLSTMWVPGGQTQATRFGDNHFYPLNHLTHLVLAILFWHLTLMLKHQTMNIFLMQEIRLALFSSSRRARGLQGGDPECLDTLDQEV